MGPITQRQLFWTVFFVTLVSFILGLMVGEWVETKKQETIKIERKK